MHVPSHVVAMSVEGATIESPMPYSLRSTGVASTQQSLWREDRSHTREEDEEEEEEEGEEEKEEEEGEEEEEEEEEETTMTVATLCW